MKKLQTYFWYLLEYLRYGDFLSVIASANYLINKKSHRHDRIVKASTGKFFCRKNTNDFQFANFRYEWTVKKFILDRLSAFDVFIDGGACTGEYCIWLSQNSKRCIAFEPIPDNHQIILKNIELNNLSDKISVFPFGLGDRNRQAKFAFDPVNTGASHISTNGSQNQLISEIRTFDSFLPTLNLNPEERILFKLDVEGMETETIKGAANFISRFSNILIVLEVKHSGREKVIEILNSLAIFEIGDIDEHNIFAKKISNYQS